MGTYKSSSPLTYCYIWKPLRFYISLHLTPKPTQTWLFYQGFSQSMKNSWMIHHVGLFHHGQTHTLPQQSRIHRLFLLLASCLGNGFHIKTSKHAAQYFHIISGKQPQVNKRLNVTCLLGSQYKGPKQSI